jgi:membrane-bound serine protease (ClpP class)
VSLPNRVLMNLLFCGMLFALPLQILAQQENAADKSGIVQLIPIRLPLSNDDDKKIQRAVIRLSQQAEGATERPVAIFEFTGQPGRAAESSEFERALSLARFLSSGDLQGIRTVAFVPETVRGHAVLVVLSCEQVVMAPTAELGEAGITEATIDDIQRAAYRDITSRRRILPVPLVLSMLDSELGVFKAVTTEGVEYVDAARLEELTSSGVVTRADTIAAPGTMAILDGTRLSGDDGDVSHLAADRQQLATALRLPAGSISEQASMVGQVTGMRVDLRGPISGSKVNSIRRIIDDRMRNDPPELLMVVINSPGGNIDSSVGLANHLLSIGDPDLLTVAVIEGEARADAVLVAAACDEIVMLDDSLLGGPGEIVVSEDEREALSIVLNEIADQKGRDWSMLLALVDQEVTIRHYQHAATAEQRFWSDQQRAEEAGDVQWNRGEVIDTTEGAGTDLAQKLQLVRHVVGSVEEAGAIFQVDGPLETARSSWIVETIERLAGEPWFAQMLLFIAFFAFMGEASAPGLGVPGFVAAVCFMLFFWIKFLHGTAGWLEAALFVGGLVFVVMEIFFLPGVGIFGIGSGLMILLSVILASQTFVVPRNSYQLQQTIVACFSVAVAGAGMITGIVVMRSVLPRTQFFQRLALHSPDEKERQQREWNESVVHYEHLLGQTGVTYTRLSPSGKVRLGEDLVDVVSDGELIEADTAIRVIDVEGNRVVVQAVDVTADGEQDDAAGEPA